MQNVKRMALVCLVIFLVGGIISCNKSTQSSQKKTQLTYMVEQIKSIDKKKDITGKYRKEVLKNIKAMDTKNSDIYVKNIQQELVKDLEEVVSYQPTGEINEEDVKASAVHDEALLQIDDVVREVETVTKDMK